VLAMNNIIRCKVQH